MASWVTAGPWTWREGSGFAEMAFGLSSTVSIAQHHNERRTSSRRRKLCRVPEMTMAGVAQTRLVPLKTGVNMEVVSQLAKQREQKAPLFFIHGSFHGAWCWNLFQTHFAELGFDSYAVSLRGSGESTIHPNEPCLERGKGVLEEYIVDLDAVMSSLQIPRPVLVGHSTGGLIAQQWATQAPPGTFAGMILLASKPPFGHGMLTFRIASKIGLPAAWRLTMAFVKKTATTDLEVCREMFFSKNGTEFDEELEGDARILEYMQKFREMSVLPVDLVSTQKTIRSPGDMKGRTLVVGGADDHIVDGTALKKTAAFYGAEGEEVIVPGTPHEVMLCSAWRVVAAHMAEWLSVLENKE